MTRVNIQFDIAPSTFIEEAAQNMSSMNSESASSILATLTKEHFLCRLDSLIERGHAIRYQQIHGIGKDSMDHPTFSIHPIALKWTFSLGLLI